MYSNYLLIAWRNLLKKPLFSSINIVGLAIGLMSCILIMLFVRSEVGYDQWIPDSERVVRMHTAYTVPGRADLRTVRSAGKVMPAARDYLRNDIEAGVRMVSWGTTVRRNGEGFDDHVLFGEEDFFKVLDLPFALGDAQSSFSKPNDLIVTEENALRYFGRTDVVGETLTICCFQGQPIELRITGVLKDLPDNTHLNISMLVYMDVALFTSFPGVLDTWNSLNVYTYFKLKPGVVLSELQERWNYWLNNESPYIENARDFSGDDSVTQVTDVVKHKFMALHDIHLKAHADAGTMGDFTTLGDEDMVTIFAMVAALILIIACINFMNLSTARAGQRAREVAMRKVLGASRIQVAIQFLIEAIGLVFISMILALVVVELVLPYYNQILNQNIAFNLLNDPALLVSLITVILAVGIGAGSYPAFVLSQYMPGHTLKASKSNDTAGSTKLRSALVVFQFAVSIGLLISTAVVYLQTQHANNMDLGYNKDQKLVLGVRVAGDNVESLQGQLENLPQVSSVVLSSEVPSQDNENNTMFTRPGVGDAEPVTELLNYHNMHFGFFEAYEVKPIAGRLFDEAFGSDLLQPATEETEGQGAVILNISAVKKLGYESAEQAVGSRLRADFSGGMTNFTVVGVINDIYFRSIKFDVRPSIYTNVPGRNNVATISYSGNPATAREAIEGVWKEVVPMEPIHLTDLNEMVARQYQQEIAQMRLFTAFAVLAILVSCLGLYGLAAFSAERRTKEIGVRKVMGASVRDIVLLLIWQFSLPVMLANLIAWPVAIYLMLDWLQQFPYRIDTLTLVPILIGAGSISLLIAWITVGGNAARVAKANPIGALRHE